MSTAPEGPKKPPEPAGSPPSVQQRLQELADFGDFGAILENFIAVPQHHEVFARLPGLLHDAVVRASRKSPRKFTGEVYRQMITFLAYLQLRLQACVEYRLQMADGQRTPLRDELPEELMERLMKPLERILQLEQQVLDAWACTDRRWALARQRPRKGTRNRLGSSFFESSN
jgi:hypothetical protein